jgi:ADP-heptose:LPS heptosyltransferase
MEILFVCGGGLGNLIQATPTFEAIVDAGHTLDISVFPHNTEKLKKIFLLPFVRKVYINENPTKRYDIQLTGPFIKSPKKCRANQHFESKFNYKQAIPEALTYYKLAQKIGKLPELKETKVNFKQGKKNDCVALFPGSKPIWQMKRWDKFDLLAKRFSKVIVVGLKQDLQKPNWSSREWQWPPHVEFAQGNLFKIANIISECKFLIGNDGGISHLAAAIGIPTYVIFGPTCPIKNRPFSKNAQIISRQQKCQPCQWNRKVWHRLCLTGNCPYNMSCLRNLSVDFVVKNIQNNP